MTQGLKQLLGFTESELDWMASRNIGHLGGKILKASQIRRLRGVLKRKGITLIIEGDSKHIKKLFKPIEFDGINYKFNNADDYFQFMKDRDLVGQFDATNMQMVMPKVKLNNGWVTPTEIVAFHEMAHVKQFEQLKNSYFELSSFTKEKYVWDQILANRHRWTERELRDALCYMNGYCTAYGQPKITIK